MGKPNHQPNLVGKKLKALRMSMPSVKTDGPHMPQWEFAEWLTDKRGWCVTQSQVCDWETKPKISRHTDAWLRDLLGMRSKKAVQANG